MASLLKFFAVAAASASLIHYAAPEYLIWSSQGWTIAVIYLTQILSTLIWRSFLYPSHFSPLKDLPSPPGGYPLVGHMPEIVKLPTGFPHSNWLKTVPNDGLIRYRYLDRDRLMPTSSKALAEVLVTKSYDFEKPPFLSQRIGRLLGPLGILFAEGEVHKRQRRMLTPAFAFRHIKNLYPLFWAKSQEMVKQVQSLDEGGSEGMVVSAEDWFSRATLDIIGEGGLSRTFNSIQDPDSELNVVYRRVFKASRRGQLLIFLSVFIPNFILKLLPIARNEAVDDAADFIRAKCKSFIDDKRAELSLSNNTQSSEEDKPTPKPELQPAGKNDNVDILSVALKSGGFSDESLVDQLMTFLAAGHETTATAMTWALHTLCEHPKIQQRLREELQAANLPSSSSETDVPITSTDIESIPYLSAFASELLRFQPPVPFTSRVAARDTSIVGQFVPKGTTVVLVPIATNRDPEFWGPDAGSFNPDRWLSTSPDGKTVYNGNGGANSNYALMTFLHGPRSCIGEKFARAEFMCLLAAWVLAFDSKATWETGGNPDDIEIDQGITRRISGGVQVKLTPLSKSSAPTTTTTTTTTTSSS